jgi:hypothetical protein
MPPPPPPPVLRPIPLVFLERISRPLLVRLLSPHSAALARLGFPLSALEASAQTERAHVTTLWHLLSTAPPDLAPLHEALLAMADLATHGGHELLLSRDSARILDREISAEDCAVTAYLEHRALFDTARPQSGQSQTKTFASFESKTPRPLPDAATHAAAFAKGMAEALEKRGRSNHFRTHEWRSGHERHLEMRYGRLASARDLLGKTGDGAVHEVTAQVTDRSTESAHAVFHDDTMHLDVAGPDWVKDLVRRVFGEAYFGTGAHFKDDGTLTLAPLACIETALATHGVPGLNRVELQQATVDLEDGSGWIAVGGKNSCRNGAVGGYALRALSDGRAVDAVFHLFIAGRTRPLTLKVVLPTKLDFERRDPRIVRIVREWAVAAGYMRLPVHLRKVEMPMDAMTNGVEEHREEWS